MRIYGNPLEMYKEVRRDLFEMGIRYQTQTVQDKQVGDDPGYQTIELFAYGYTLKDFSTSELSDMMNFSGANIDWATMELRDRLLMELSNKNPGRAFMTDLDNWKGFLRDGAFSYTYAERWQYQLPYIIRELRSRPNTRQAVMTMYDVHQDMMNWGGRDRVPCSLSYQFVLRDRSLSMIYNQRSCDFVRFFATDVYHSCGLLQYVAKELGVNRGSFVHVIGSLHAFAKDLEGKGIF